MTADGTPVATAIVSSDAVRNMYIDLLCSNPCSGAGLLLVKHLQTVAATDGMDKLVIWGYNEDDVAVLRKCGFFPNSLNNRCMFDQNMPL